MKSKRLFSTAIGVFLLLIVASVSTVNSFYSPINYLNSSLQNRVDLSGLLSAAQVPNSILHEMAPSDIGPTDNTDGRLFTWGDVNGNVVIQSVSVSDTDPLALAGQIGANDVLSVTYNIGGWGGFSSDPSAAQDWSGYEGLSFWFYGMNTGTVVDVQIRDIAANPSDTGNRENYVAKLTDDFDGWGYISFPWSSFEFNGYNPNPDNQILDLQKAYGYAIQPAIAQGSFYIDKIGLYGNVVTPPQTPQVKFESNTFSVLEGGLATISVTLNMTSTDVITATYTLANGTAIAGDDYVLSNGQVNFAAGGLLQTFTVQTLDDTETGSNKTILLTLSAPQNADLGSPSAATLIILEDELPPYRNPSLPVDERVDDLMGRMTLNEKIGQMTQVEQGSSHGGQDIIDYHLGSMLSGGGGAPSSGNTALDWANMYDAYQKIAVENTRLGIPLIYGVDAVHGHSNVYGATIFPHNIGLGATRNPTLNGEIARITALEVAATGIDWTFAPTVAVARDERWGRTYESYGEHPEIANMMMTTVITGYQAPQEGVPYGILATAKHFVGDGGTTGGDDQGNTQLTEAEIRAIHLPPYAEAITADVGSMMPSYSSINSNKMHGSNYWLKDVLRDEMGFDGFLISDWAAVDQLPEATYQDKVAASVNAGVDMVMVPYDASMFATALKNAVQANDVSQARVDEAVRRILVKKFELGLFEEPYTNRDLFDKVGAPEHRAVARQAVRESLVMLKNEANTLPLSKSIARLVVAGKNADDIGNQSGGWTISWQGSSGETTIGDTILDGIRATVSSGTTVTYVETPTSAISGDMGIVVVGETPYAEGAGDNQTLALDSADINTINIVCANMPCVVVLVSGRPLMISDVLDQTQAFVAAWLPGSEGGGVADVLFGDHSITGKLPMTWPRNIGQVPINVGDAIYDPLFAYGYGLNYENAPQYKVYVPLVVR
ncbi:MAG: glycoside hydrolase family 3 N-terminal domain-containing protein [Candidatus Promineifilaceae bacterium]